MIGSGCRHLCRVLVTGVLLLPLSVGATPTDRIIIKVAESMRPAMLADGGPAPRARQRVAALSTATGRELAWLRAMSGGADVLVLPEALSLHEVDAIAASLAQIPGVEYAVPDHRVFSMLTPNDPSFSTQWHLQPLRTVGAVRYSIDAPEAWNFTTGDAITVAVVDTGVLFTHEDLRGKVLPGYDFVSEDSSGVVFTANDGDGRDPMSADPGDWVTSAETLARGCPTAGSSWHGAHMAGIIAAATNNGLGVAGVSWGAMILPIRSLGKCGGYSSDVIDGIRWAAGLPVSGAPPNLHAARVINLSLGDRSECNLVWQNAINDATAAGALVIAAAGNVSPNGNNLDQVEWVPASCQNTLTVAATDQSGTRPAFSNYGSVVDVSAPGTGIQSTIDSGAQYPVHNSAYLPTKSGTSVATAIVSGAAALVLSRNPALTPSAVATILTHTDNVTPFPSGSNCTTVRGCGSGILNAALAVDAVVDAGNRPQVSQAFDTVINVNKSALVTSNVVEMDSSGDILDISVVAGEYSIGCSSTFTAMDQTISGTQSVCVRHAASAYPDHPATTVLTVGNHRMAFVTMTGSADTTPDLLVDFMPKSGVNPGATVTSDTITVQGIDAPAPVQVSGDDVDRKSRYSLNCASGGFTTEPGYIAPGGSICVRHVASEELSEDATSTLVIGGVSIQFTTTTRDTQSSGGGGASGWWFLAGLLGYTVSPWFRKRRRPPQTSPASAP